MRISTVILLAQAVVGMLPHSFRRVSFLPLKYKGSVLSYLGGVNMVPITVQGLSGRESLDFAGRGETLQQIKYNIINNRNYDLFFHSEQIELDLNATIDGQSVAIPYDTFKEERLGAISFDGIHGISALQVKVSLRTPIDIQRTTPRLFEMIENLIPVSVSHSHPLRPSPKQNTLLLLTLKTLGELRKKGISATTASSEMATVETEDQTKGAEAQDSPQSPVAEAPGSDH